MPRHDLVVVGGGPGGYVAAIRAAQLGLDVACVEKEPALGGTCLRIGCIPSKALLESSHRLESARFDLAGHGVKVSGRIGLDLGAMMKRKEKTVQILTRGIDSLFKKNGITHYHGQGSFLAPRRLQVVGEEAVEIEAEHVIIATGSEASSLSGVDVDGERICTSTEALSWGEVPKSLVVIGAGAIGLELGSVWRRLGAEVVVLEYMDRILPEMDGETAHRAAKILGKQGLDIRTGVRVTGARLLKKSVKVEVDGSDPISCEKLLVAVGRRPCTEGLGLEAIGLETDRQGGIPVNEELRTAVDGVWAIGDVVRGPMLAHKAEEEGVAVAERIVTGHGHVNYDAIPAIVYTEPEVAGVGRTEESLREAGVDYRKGEFPFVANGRARALGTTDGQVKILADAGTDRILGVHVVGPHAGDLIAEAAVAMEFGASAEDLARSCHAHPTLAEAVKEAALAVDGRAIHV